MTADGTVVPFAGAEPLELCGALDARPRTRSATAGRPMRAWLGVPGYLAVADDGSVYYPDIYDNRIRRIVPTAASRPWPGPARRWGTAATTGRRSRHAWPGRAASRCRPSGGLLFTDSGNNRIRLLDDVDLRPAALPADWSPGVRPLAALSDRGAPSRRRRRVALACPPAPGPDPGCAARWRCAPMAWPAPRAFDLAPGGRDTLPVPLPGARSHA